MHPQSDSMVEWFNRRIQHDTFATSIWGCWQAWRTLEPLYSSIHVGISIFNSWEYTSYISQDDIWSWIEAAMWLGVWNTSRKANASQWIYHGDKKLPKKNLTNYVKLITYSIRPDEDSLQHLSQQPRIFCWEIIFDKQLSFQERTRPNAAARLRWTICDYEAAEWCVANPETRWLIQSCICGPAGR